MADKYKSEAAKNEKIKSDIQSEKTAQKKTLDELNSLWLSSDALNSTSHSAIASCTGCDQCKSMPPGAICLTVAVSKP